MEENKFGEIGERYTKPDWEKTRNPPPMEAGKTGIDVWMTSGCVNMQQQDIDLHARMEIGGVDLKSSARFDSILNLHRAVGEVEIGLANEFKNLIHKAIETEVNEITFKLNKHHEHTQGESEETDHSD